MLVYPQIEAFLKTYCKSNSPLLLALSGGADSLCLFYCLLIYRSRWGVPFHIAHVDHGWREESQQEAFALRKLAQDHQVPFHLKTLNPALLKGNLEAACREERYAFFSKISLENNFQGVLTGHHQNDQAETVFKRVLEGAHWSRWPGLKPEITMNGVRILRPLLKLSKNEIQQALDQEHIKSFDDPTNRQLAFLRARFRESLFPRLNQEFGKEVQQSFIEIAEEAGDLRNFFEKRLNFLLENVHRGAWGSYFDFQETLPAELIEIKFLLRMICEREKFFLSRSLIEQAALALQRNGANLHYIMGERHIRVDRRRFFILTSSLSASPVGLQELNLGSSTAGEWKLDVGEAIFPPSFKATSWKEGWKGECYCYLPLGNYSLGWSNQNAVNHAAIKKRWCQSKVPAFLYDFFPLVWKDKAICHEFLTGRAFTQLKEGDRCLRVEVVRTQRPKRTRK